MCSSVFSAFWAVCALREAAAGAAPEPSAPQQVSADQLKAAIDKLGDFDCRQSITGAARTGPAYGRDARRCRRYPDRR